MSSNKKGGRSSSSSESSELVPRRRIKRMPPKKKSLKNERVDTKYDKLKADNSSLSLRDSRGIKRGIIFSYVNDPAQLNHDNNIPSRDLMTYLTSLHMDEYIDVTVHRLNRIVKYYVGDAKCKNTLRASKLRNALSYSVRDPLYSSRFKKYVWYFSGRCGNHSDSSDENDFYQVTLSQFIHEKFFKMEDVIKFLDAGNMIKCNSILAYTLIKMTNSIIDVIDVMDGDLLLANVAATSDVKITCTTSMAYYIAEVGRYSKIKTASLISESHDDDVDDPRDLIFSRNISQLLSEMNEEEIREFTASSTLNMIRGMIESSFGSVSAYRWMEPLFRLNYGEKLNIQDPLINVYFPWFEYRCSRDHLCFAYNKNCSNFSERKVIKFAKNMVKGRIMSDYLYHMCAVSLYTLMLNNQLSANTLEEISGMCDLYKWMVSSTAEYRVGVKSARS
jgi:hypothetical protein